MGRGHLTILFSILLLGIGIPCEADGLPYINKTFRSISESECNLKIQLNSDRTGVAVQACVLEDGSGRVVEGKFKFTWQADGDTIVVVTAHGTDTFRYTNRAPTLFPPDSTAPALILTTKNRRSSVFGGYGGRTLWKYPFK